MFALRNIVICTFLCDSRLRRSEMSWPLFENTRSLGTDVATIHRCFFAILASVGYTLTRLFHHASGSSCRSMCGSSKYCRTSMMAEDVGVVMVDEARRSNSPHIPLSSSCSSAVCCPLVTCTKSRARNHKTNHEFIHTATKNINEESNISNKTYHEPIITVGWMHMWIGDVYPVMLGLGLACQGIVNNVLPLKLS